jgi:diguanylate cyclase (GGDEF)-like protein
MWTKVCHVEDIATLDENLNRLVQYEPMLSEQNILVQAYFAPEFTNSIIDTIECYLPTAKIVGCTAYGLISPDGLTSTGISLFIMCFQHSDFRVSAIQVSLSNEYQSSYAATQQTLRSLSDVQGILVLLPIREFNNEAVVSGVVDAAGDIPVFGGIAADQNELTTTQVISNCNSRVDNVVLVFLFGQRLRILTHSYLGWVPFGEIFKVTEVEDQKILSINQQPAFRLYSDYTGIESENFYSNALDFPFILNREGVSIARVPSRVVDRHALVCTGNIHKGDLIQFSYGNPDTIFSQECYADEIFQAFNPDAIMIFSCCIRMALLEEQHMNEILPYKKIAPVMGIFTFGEINSEECGPNILNATLVSVGIKEYEPSETIPDADIAQLDAPIQPCLIKNNRFERLMNVVSRMTHKLHQANVQLEKLTYIDPLTKALNRRAFHEQSEECLLNSEKYSTCSLIFYDIDDFKHINDDFGHLVGDQVLTRLVELSQLELPSHIVVARYGGEEFAIMLPNVSVEEAIDLAERIRARVEIESEDATLGLPGITCSFGIGVHQAGDSVQKLINRADKQLYRAKRLGKNTVCSD